MLSLVKVSLPAITHQITRQILSLMVVAFIAVTAAPICLNDKPEIVINERASLVGWGKLSGQNNLVINLITRCIYL